MQGTSLQLQVFPHAPLSRTGPWQVVDDAGLSFYYYLPTQEVVDGAVIAVATNAGDEATYNELYVYVESVGDWRKADLNWPKIDPNTGQPFDQYLEWYSPLAE